MSKIFDGPLVQAYLSAKDETRRLIECKTGQSVKDGYNTGLASQFMMGTIQSGQSVKDGYNKLTGQFGLLV
jgi:hypothetical protein